MELILTIEKSQLAFSAIKIATSANLGGANLSSVATRAPSISKTKCGRRRQPAEEV